MRPDRVGPRYRGYGRWEIGGGQFSISDILSTIFCPDLVGALADGVREVGDLPNFQIATEEACPFRDIAELEEWCLIS